MTINRASMSIRDHDPVPGGGESHVRGRSGCGRVARRRAMGLVELLFSLAAVAIVLGVLVLISESLRRDTSERKTRDVLRTLRMALNAYHDRHDAWPVGPGPAQALAALLDDPVTEAMVRPLSLVTDDQGGLAVQDGYGCPIGYVRRTDGGAERVDFVSAGPDGQFGDLGSGHPKMRSAAIDDLYGSDLEPPIP